MKLTSVQISVILYFKTKKKWIRDGTWNFKFLSKLSCSVDSRGDGTASEGTSTSLTPVLRVLTVSEAPGFLQPTRDRGLSWELDQLYYFNQPKPINTLINSDDIKSMSSV